VDDLSQVGAIPQLHALQLAQAKTVLALVRSQVAEVEASEGHTIITLIANVQRSSTVIAQAEHSPRGHVRSAHLASSRSILHADTVATPPPPPS
jgi:hypothetical protein